MGNPEDLLHKLNKSRKEVDKPVEKKTLESTSADSSLSGLFSSEESDSESRECNVLPSITDPSELSLMLKGDPCNSMILLKYLKHYSEILFSWGEKELAVQACKLIANACSLLREYHHESLDMDINSAVYLGTNYHFH